jgi:hypothetical protein
MNIENEDFIAVFDDVLDDQDCTKLVQYFENLKSFNLTYDRQRSGDGLPHTKSDETAFLLGSSEISFTKDHPVVAKFLEKFWSCYDQYARQFSVLMNSELHGIYSMRLQKTLPGQGYHIWHYESADSMSSRRLVAWSIYLNDVDQGGETEFLYMKKRISAKRGRLLIWPAAFTHTHRGNPPLSGEKYLLTGWLEFFGNPKS